MTDKQKQARPRAKQTDRDSQSIVYTFIAAVVVLCVLVFIHKLFSRGSTMIQTLDTLAVLRWVFLALAVLLALGAIYRRRKSGGKMLLRLTVIALMAGLSSWVMADYFLNGVKFLCGFYVLAALVYLVWLIYRAEFFTVCLLIAVTGLSLWIMLMAPGSVGAYAALAVGLMCCIVYSVLVVLARRGKGKLKLHGKTCKLYSGNTAYGAMAACAMASAAALIVGVLGTTYAYYCIIAMVCVAFVYAVYYTVKLM